MLKIYKNIYLYLKGMDKQIAINLTNDEQKIFKMLKQYRDELGLNTVLRVAGGWVRDKVMYFFIGRFLASNLKILILRWIIWKVRSLWLFLKSMLRIVNIKYRVLGSRSSILSKVSFWKLPLPKLITTGSISLICDLNSI